MQKKKHIIDNTKCLILKFLKKREGQSLIEVLVGLTIGAILIGGASLGIGFILKSTTSNDNLQSASGIVRQTLDEVRSYASARWQNIYSLTKGSGAPYFLNASGTAFYTIEGKESVLSRDVTSGLVGRWGFDEATGTVAYDMSGNGNDGTFVNSPTRATSTCQVGYCLSFSGSNYVNIQNIPQTTERTYSWWHKISTNGSAVFPSPIAHGGYSNGMRVIWRDDTSDKTTVQITTGSDTTPTFTLGSPTIDEVGIWYHYVLTYDGINTGKLYKNGILVDTKTNGTGTIKTTASPFYIGMSQFYWNGSVDDVRIYNRVLTATEVKNLYDSKPFLSFFTVENVCRSNDSSSTIASTEPCVGGSIVDPITQKLTSRVEWNDRGTTNNMELGDYITRWKNKVFHQTDWSGGSGIDGPLTLPNTQYSSSTNVDATTNKGSIRIRGL